MMVWNATVYEIMKHANRVNSVLCILLTPVPCKSKVHFCRTHFLEKIVGQIVSLTKGY